MPQRATTAQLLTDALTLPPGSTISGQPVFLVSVVATAPQRQRQIDAVHAYWRLAEATGEYHVSDHSASSGSPGCGQVMMKRPSCEPLKRLPRRNCERPSCRSLPPSTTWRRSCSWRLALPCPCLPTNRWLVLIVRGSRNCLPEGWLPNGPGCLIRHYRCAVRAVESHAAAVTAAEDALDAAIELQAGGQEHSADVVAALDGQVRQQRAFLAAVSRYNHDIADYALVVVPPQTTPAVLVGTLIKLNRPAGQPVVPLPTTAALGSVGILPASSSIPTWPTRAAPPGGTADQGPEVTIPAGAEETAPANSPGGVGILPASPAVVAPPNPQQNSEPEEPRLAPPQETAIPLLEQGAGSGKQQNQSVPPPSVLKSPSGPTTRTSQKPISGSDPSQGFSPETHEDSAMSTWSQA